MTLKYLLSCVELSNSIKIFVQNSDGTSRYICTFKDSILALGYLPDKLLNAVVLNVSGENKSLKIYLDCDNE